MGANIGINTHNLKSNVFRKDRFTNYGWRSAESSLPISVAEHRDWIAAWLVVFHSESATENRSETHDRIEIAGDEHIHDKVSFTIRLNREIAIISRE